MKDKNIKIKKNEQGTVLLLALLLMASVVVAGVGMGQIIMSQIQQAILTDDSITAFYAAEAGLESSLFKLRALDMSAGSLPVAGTLDNGATWSITTQSSRADVTVSLADNQTYQLDLFNPDNLAEAPGIESLRFTWTGAGQLEMAYISWFPSAAINTAVWPQQEYQVVTPPLSLVGPAVIRNEFSANQAYRVRLRAVNGALSSLNITGWSMDNAVAGSQIAMPSHISLSSTGRFARARQALSASIPRFAQLSGIFDFVLFSEEKISKE
ncbi:MAG: hypothetical protein PHW53_03190 [Patescibacteria group bacterium]|nr:hypothetical protein [Patescibacteria group bacterium]